MIQINNNDNKKKTHPLWKPMSIYVELIQYKYASFSRTRSEGVVCFRWKINCSVYSLGHSVCPIPMIFSFLHPPLSSTLSLPLNCRYSYDIYTPRIKGHTRSRVSFSPLLIYNCIKCDLSRFTSIFRRHRRKPFVSTVCSYNNRLGEFLHLICFPSEKCRIF